MRIKLTGHGTESKLAVWRDGVEVGGKLRGAVQTQSHKSLLS